MHLNNVLALLHCQSLLCTCCSNIDQVIVTPFPKMQTFFSNYVKGCNVKHPSLKLLILNYVKTGFAIPEYKGHFGAL